MKLIFAGTPEFAAVAMTALHAAGHDLALILTQPDRPAGRGQKLTPSAVARVATGRGLRVEKPENLKAPETQALLRGIHADVMVVAAYGQLLPPAVLAIPAKGCLNIHASLLPRWRGAAPIQRAIEAGDSETGITIMQMDAGLDTGAVLLTRAVTIQPTDTAVTLFTRLGELGAETIVDALSRLGSLSAVAQAATGVTYARKISKSEAQIDWSQPAIVIERKLRAFDPFPGSETRFAGETLKIWRATVETGRVATAAGTIIEHTSTRLVVQCGVDALALHSVQRPGGTRLSIAEFLRGTRIDTGARFA